ncbi:complex I NDUFA9 subunit family protein [Nitrococcus mobilis]|uniref:NAD-dependent epimerase/dehydratase n=1 Tax=Nitrococcus mobilis Nb-231 TaxID=314278 RepID=A4BN54_9GAMM|nr:complex I NDUFA9 subunit family protein [Nitrococcus mobilis]EAR22653.1 NAD-dependent epimerase/dehydratase [Nitrococcus mobilis Nb-231]
MRVETICVLGGTGFVGRHIAGHLANTRVRLRVLTRNRERNRQLLPIPNLQLIEVAGYDQERLTEQFAGCQAVINLVGVLNEGRGAGHRFEDAHVKLPEHVIAACRTAGVGRLLHMSALGAAPDAASRYQQTKAAGECVVKAAHSENLAVTVFRPSVIFGPGDSFLSRFAQLLQFFPVLLLPTPRLRLKPVYVGDVAKAFVQSLEDEATFGQCYELCGPKVFTLRELVDYVATLLGVRRLIIGLNEAWSQRQARLLERVPGKPYSYDNYLSSKVDNICSDDGLARLGIHAAAVEAIVPGYIGRRRAQRRYDDFRRTAGRD